MTPVYKLSASSIKGRTNYGSMLAGNTAFAPRYFESIATVTVGAGGSSSVEFTSIPGTFTHLQVRGIARTTRASNESDAILMRFNSDSGSNYARHQLNGDGASASADAGTSTTGMQINRFTASSATASNFGALVSDILDYTNTNKNTTVRTLGGYDNNGSGLISFNSGLWMNTAAITTITLTSLNSANFAQYSHFALYGIKGA